MSSKAKILAVDDDPINLCILAELLGDEYELQTLANGDEFLETARRFHPDLILLDVMMPGANGYDLCRAARVEPGLRNVKIILVSSKQTLVERMIGYDAGADDYVTKPFDTDEFLAKVKVYLRLKSIEEVDQLKSSILTLLNHETRTPLTGVLAPAELLLAHPNMSETNRLHMLNVIFANAKRLESLVEKVAWLSSLRDDAESQDLGTVDIARALSHSITRVGEEWPKRRADMHLASPASAMLTGNERSLRMVCRTLLDNAIRYSEAGDRVETELVTDDRGLLLTVSNHGKGIEPEFLPRVFDAFVVGDIAHHEGGIGISLAIARGIVEGLGGEITVTSVPGVRTCFQVRLPHDRAQAVA